MGRKGVEAKQDLFKHSLKKCNLLNILDGREDALINIKDIEGYEMLLLEKKFQMINKTDIRDDDDVNSLFYTQK